MNAKIARAGWDLFPELAVDPCPCHFPLCCCKALSHTSMALLVLFCLCCDCLLNCLLSLLRGWCCHSLALRYSLGHNVVSCGMERASLPRSCALNSSSQSSPLASQATWINMPQFQLRPSLFLAPFCRGVTAVLSQCFCLSPTLFPSCFPPTLRGKVCLELSDVHQFPVAFPSNQFLCKVHTGTGLWGSPNVTPLSMSQNASPQQHCSIFMLGLLTAVFQFPIPCLSTGLQPWPV